LASVVDLRERHPRPGFARADEVVDPKKYADALEEVARLKQQVEIQSSESPFDGFDTHVDLIFGAEDGGDRIYRSITLCDAFIAVSEAILSGLSRPTELAYEIGRTLGKEDFKCLTVNELVRILFGRRLLEFKRGEEVGYVMTSIPAADLIHWSLTEYGQEQYGLLRDITSIQIF
jgi:hypothetical protein